MILIVENDIGHSDTDHISPLTHLLHAHLDKNSVKAKPSGIGLALVGTACLPEDAIRRADRAGGAVWREWEPKDLIACRTLVNGNRPLMANTRRPTRLGFALMLSSSSLRPASCAPRGGTCTSVT
jgi:hypothetical protein